MPVRPIATRTEHSQQSLIVKWCVEQDDPRCWLITAIPNAGKRSRIAGAELKREGMRPGFPDLLLPVPSSGYHGLFIELKTLKGTVTPEQEQWLRDLNKQGYQAVLCRGSEAAIAVIKKYLEM